MTRKLVKRFNRLDLHDAILNSITLDFVDSQVKFNLEYIVNLIEESGGVLASQGRRIEVVNLAGNSKED